MEKAQGALADALAMAALVERCICQGKIRDAMAHLMDAAEAIGRARGHAAACGGCLPASDEITASARIKGLFHELRAVQIDALCEGRGAA